MIQIENTEVMGWEAAIRGMRNPMNSWERSDSFIALESCKDKFCRNCHEWNNFKCCNIGPNDHDLMMWLANGGPVHAKYRRMITVYCDILAPLYWWKEFDTHKVGTVANSCSTMHKIAAKEFTPEDFSHEHLVPAYLDALKRTIDDLNSCREAYQDKEVQKNPVWHKQVWWQMIQLLPSSYNQRRTVMLNYEVLANIYHYRKDHKLDEWRDFCQWITTLPYSEIITGSNQS